MISLNVDTMSKTSLSKINLVVVGHKDHGKSTLIGRLLYDSNAVPEQKLQEIEAELKKAGDESFRFAFLLDTLEEERKGGLTIDIMQIPFKTKAHLYTIIDCPGHSEFIKKMFTGASQADAAVLVVSAKEGIQEQTKEHALLINTLGIRQLIVAVNKMDVVQYAEARYKDMCGQLQPILGSLGYNNPPIVPVSALDGENVSGKSDKMEWYEGSSLIETLDQNITPTAPPLDKPLRASVQDVYEVGNEKVIICRILTGLLQQGKTVCLDPSGESRVVKKMEMYGREIEKAGPGDSVGIVTHRTVETRRGEVISYPQNRAKIPKSFTAETVLFDTKIESDDVVTIRCGTAEKKCKVEEIIEKIDPVNLTTEAKSPQMLKSGEIGKLVFSPVERMCVEKYSEFPELGRFVVEDRKGAVAAGIVIETQTA